MFTQAEIEIIIDALNMALASNKRMQASKPKFSAVFAQIETDLNTLKAKLQTPHTQGQYNQTPTTNTTKNK